MRHFRQPDKPAKEPDRKGVALRRYPPGREVCERCGALIPVGGADCVVCHGEPRAHPDPDGWRERMTDPAGMRGGRRANLKAGLLLIALLMLSALGVGGREYIGYQRLVSLYTAKGAIFYSQNRSALKIALPSLDEPLLLATGERWGAPLRAQASHDGRYLLYFGDQSRDSANARWLGDLYLLDLVQLHDPSAEREGALIEPGIADFAFSDRRDLYAYVTAVGDLMLCDYGSRADFLPLPRPSAVQLVDTGVSGIAAFDGGTLVYYKGDRTGPDSWQENRDGESGRPLDLYYTAVGDQPMPPTLIGEGLYQIADATRDYSRVVYLKRTRSLPLPLYEIHLYEQSAGGSRLLAEDARYVVSASAAKGAAVYLSPSEETLSFRDLFDDDLLEFDQLMVEPDPVAYGVLDQWGGEVAGMDAIERQERWALFDEDMDAYRIKEKRDQLRRSLREQMRAYMQSNYLSYNLNYAAADTVTQLAGNLYNWKNDPSLLATGSIDANYLIYSTGVRDDLARTLISSLTETEISALLATPFDLPDALSRSVPLILRYETLTGESQDVFTESGPRYPTFFYPTPAGDGFYFCSADYATGSGNLYYVETGANMSQQVLYVDEDVNAVIGMAEGQNTGLFYQKTTRGAFPSQNICHAVRSQSKVIATGTDSVDDACLAGENSSVLLFFRDGEREGSRKLYLYQTQERYIAQDVEDYSLRGAGLIFLLRSESAGGVQLSLYDNGETRTLDGAIDDYRWLD